MAGNDYVVNIVLKAKEEAAAAFAGMSAHLAVLAAETVLVNEALKHLNDTANEHSGILSHMALDQMSVVAATERMAASLEGKLTPAMNNVNRASGNNGGAASGLYAFVQGAIPGQQTAGNIAIAVAAAAVAFAPLSTELAASLVLLGAWVVGATAFLAVITLAVAPIALLTGAIVLLGISATGGQKALDNLAPAQKAAATAAETHENALQALARAQLAYDNNPSAANLLRLQQAHEHVADAADKNAAAQQKLTVAQINANGAFATFDKHIEALTKTLGTAAIPMMATWIGWIDSLIPRVQELALRMFDWYGQRLPAIVQIANQAVNAGLSGVERFAEAWGHFFDRTLAQAPQFGGIINGAFNRVIDGAIGLLLSLEALSNWFVARLPVLGANADATFANLGTVIRAVGSALGVLVDWVIGHWPAINAAFNATVTAFQQAWAVIGPIIQVAWKNALAELAPYFKYIEDNAKSLLPVVIALAAVIGAAIIILIAIGAVLVLVAAGIVWLTTKISEAVVEWIAAGKVLGGFFSDLGGWVQARIRDVGTFFSELGDGAHQIAMALGAAAVAVGAFFSGLGSGVQAGLSAIGGFFSAFGGAVRAVVDTIGSFFDAILGVITQIGNVIGVVLRAIQTVVITALAIILGFFILQFTAIWNFISPLLERIRDLVGAVFSAIGTTISTVLNFVWHGVIEPVWSAVLVFLIATWNTIVQVATVTWTFWYGVISHWVTMARDFIISIWNAILGFLTTTWNLIVQIAGTAWNLWYSTVSHWIQVVWDFIVSVWNAIVGFLGVTWETINQLANRAWNAVWGTITGWAASIRDTVQGVWDGMIKAGGKAMSDLGTAVHGGLGEVVKVLNSFINATNAVLDPVMGKSGKGADVAIQTIPGFARGGVLPGYAPGQDIVPALLSPGEGILTPQAVRGMGGAAAIDNINAQYQHFASGGVVNPYPKGQCTWGVWEMFPGMPVDGDAHSWINLPLAHASAPAAGEIVVYDSGLPGSGGYGHVARVDGGLVNGLFPVTETNYTHPLGWDTRMSSLSHVAGFLLPGVPGAPGGASGLAIDLLSPIVDAALNAAKGLISNVPAWLRDLPGPLLDQLAGGVKSKFAALFNTATNAFSGLTGGIASASGNLSGWISQALALTGVPGSWAGPLSVLIGRESSGNPNAINLSDSNARAGHPSQGLMQLIPSNFAAYHVPGTSNSITDPVANIAAGIRYILSRYGSIFSVQQANALLPPLGYDHGGSLPQGLSTVWNGTGRVENVTPANSMDDVLTVLRSIDARLGQALGQPRVNATSAMARY